MAFLVFLWISFAEGLRRILWIARLPAALALVHGHLCFIGADLHAIVQVEIEAARKVYATFVREEWSRIRALIE